MAFELCILSCRSYFAEVTAVVASEEWTDVYTACFPANCGRPPLTWTDLQAVLPDSCTHVLLLSSICGAVLGDPPAGFPPVRILTQAQCFDLLANAPLIQDLLESGAYLLSPGWLKDWREQIARLGFTAETCGEMYREIARELVLLDTGIDPESAEHLREFAAAAGLPARRVPVGLEHLRLLLAKTVAEWRLRLERLAGTVREAEHRRASADQLIAVELISQIARAEAESAVIASIEELCRMLFAPAIWHYIRVDHGQLRPSAEFPAQYREPLRQLRSSYAWTPSQRGFLLRIAQGEEALGFLVIDELALPENLHRYLNLARTLTGVFALAIENARNRKRLIEAEKMGSLGMMVAGVAHEINTPLGVGLAAASTLQDQTQNLATRFAERRMTQTDLQGFLQAATQEAGLIRNNLERIGRITDAFRQVAVDGHGPDKRSFRPRTCIEDVLAGFGDRLAAGNITVRIDCDEHLEVTSYPGDCASVFTNLIGNSLQHGFKQRATGLIEIRINAHERIWEVDYADDGEGMPAEVKARVFEPFFTTDLQHGMGLGMHLVYNLITHRFGGRIACVDADTSGAHFHIEIPQ